MMCDRSTRRVGVLKVGVAVWLMDGIRPGSVLVVYGFM